LGCKHLGIAGWEVAVDPVAFSQQEVNLDPQIAEEGGDELREKLAHPVGTRGSIRREMMIHKIGRHNFLDPR
jgi:hypothetical protein